jgi:hypothetical protein
MFTWDSRTLYDPPSVGICSISGAYETGRFYNRDGKRVFIGNGEAPDAVRDYVGFLTALRAVGDFKRGYPKSAWTAARAK